MISDSPFIYYSNSDKTIEYQKEMILGMENSLKVAGIMAEIDVRLTSLMVVTNLHHSFIRECLCECLDFCLLRTRIIH